MNIDNILKPASALKRAFGNLETGLSDVLNEAFVMPPMDADGNEIVGADQQSFHTIEAEEAMPVNESFPDIVADPRPLTQPATIEPAPERITAHTQNRLAAYSAFDEARSASQKDLGYIGEALASVIATHHLSREFLNDCYADIHRANEMEVQNAALSAQTRRFADRLDKLEKQRIRYEALVELQKRKEAKLSQETETLREELNAVKLDAVEARNVLARTESQQSELHATLAAKSSQAERLLRENELLRDKSVNLALDLEKSVKKQAEFRRKHDDLAAIHASESSNYAEMTARFSSAEKEVARVQKIQVDLEARLQEASESLHAVEQEMTEREKRFQSENHALKSENQMVSARLQAVTTEHLDAVSEVAALKTRLSNLDSEKHVAEKKYATLSAEIENGRKNPVPDSSKRDQVEVHKKEAATLRAEVTALNDKLKRLTALEKLHEAAKQRARERADFPNTFGLTAAATDAAASAPDAGSKKAANVAM